MTKRAKPKSVASKSAAKRATKPQATTKPTARTGAPKKRAGKMPATTAASTRSPMATSGRREQAAVEAAKYTPSPLKSSGWPAFRYPL
jgi:hypothetical protein